MHFLADKIIAVSFGRDRRVNAKQWTLSLNLIPRLDLTPEGDMIWSGLGLEFTFQAPLSRGWGSRQCEANRVDYRWKTPVSVWVRSDVSRITASAAA